jgi:histidinol dehydrogenase
MKLIKTPARDQWPALLQRPAIDPFLLEKNVKEILNKVKKGGDKALKKLTKELDGAKLRKLRVSEREIIQAEQQLPDQLKQAIRMAKANIVNFHASQLQQTGITETMPGIQCWRRSVGIEKVGLYIPGGTAALFSTVLMLGIPARLAGCKEIVLCSPPQKGGKLHPAVLFAAKEIGITSIIKAGGAQAIAAMAYGTESVPQVFKLFGPGNQYVTCAKQLLQSEGIAIDMPAGPSEVCVLADSTACPPFIAADLLSQAEHGPDSQVILVTDSLKLINAVRR